MEEQTQTQTTPAADVALTPDNPLDPERLRGVFGWMKDRETAREIPKKDRLRFLVDYLKKLNPAEDEPDVLDAGDDVDEYLVECHLRGSGEDLFWMNRWLNFNGVFKWDSANQCPLLLSEFAGEAPPVCGTAGCAAGWAVLLFSDYSPADLFTAEQTGAIEGLGTFYWEREAAQLLGIEDHDAERIFALDYERGEKWAIGELELLIEE